MTPFASARPTAGREQARASFNVKRAALPVLLAAFVLLGSLYAVATPLFEVSDELWHYPMVKTLADGQGLPVQNPANPGPWRQEGSQPPLYYALMAAVTSWIDTSDINVVRWINPHADNGVITPDGNNNIIIHTFREAWPWYGTVLAVRLIRFLSVLLGAGTVYFTYRLALELAPGHDDLALAAAGFTAFTPMFVFVSASVNNDNLAILLSAAILWLLVRWLRGRSPRRAWEFVLLGTLLGAAALSKTSALGLWPLAGGVLAWIQIKPWLESRPLRETDPPKKPVPAVGQVWGAGDERRRRLDWPAFSVLRPWSFVLVFGTALIISAWWFIRNFILYRDWLGWNAFLDAVGRRPHLAGLLQLWGERVGFVQAYWGLFGGVSVPMPDWAYLALNGIAGLAAIGLIWGLAQAARRRQVGLNEVIPWGLVVAWIVLIMVGLIRWTSLTWASQGRLIFPAISAIGVLAAAGLARIWRGLPWLALAFMGALTAVVPFVVIGPHYQAPQPLTGAQLGQITNRLDNGAGADFSGEMKLLGYQLQERAVAPGQSLHLTLFWQAQTAMDRNWSIFVHVVDDQGVIVAQRDRYPGNGALATTLLAPGEAFADDYVIPIPDVTYAPAPARIEVGLYDLVDETRLPLAAGGDSLSLEPVSLAERPPVSLPGLGQIPNPIKENFANQLELIGYDLDRRSARPGEALHLTLYWRASGPIAKNYSFFAHVRGDGETLWAGQDGWPQQGAAPTSTWRTGQVVKDSYQLALKINTPPGQYAIEVGLYDASGERLGVYDAGGTPTDSDFVYLSKIRVEAP
jgi:hypothetical protein